jgi:hypothetical protein
VDLARDLDGFATRLRLGHYVDVRFAGQQRFQPLANNVVIIYDQNAYTHNANLIDWNFLFSRKNGLTLSKTKWGETRGHRRGYYTPSSRLANGSELAILFWLSKKAEGT